MIEVIATCIDDGQNRRIRGKGELISGGTEGGLTPVMP